MTDFVKVKASEVQVGDWVDLEADKYADPDHDHDIFTYEYLEVNYYEYETKDCIAIGFEGWDVCGFPPDHLLTVRV